MKEKIERLSKGEFQYKLPELVISDELISFVLEPGMTIRGSFTVSNALHTRMKGVLYSSNRLLVLDDDRFIGEENTIRYHCTVKWREPGSIINGSIHIVTDCGESSVPYVITIEAPSCDTSVGKIKDLYQFANLARENWEEAVALFASGELGRILVYYDKKNYMLYESLKKSSSQYQALEEFLVSVHKKTTIQFHASKSELTYEAGAYNFMDTLELRMEGWGYQELTIATDAPFLRLEHTKITSQQFANKAFPLGLVIQASKMKPGCHYGNIIIETVNQKVVISVMCHCIKKVASFTGVKRAEIKQKLMENYLRFRTGQLSAGKYSMEAEQLLTVLSGRSSAGDPAAFKLPEFSSERKLCSLYRVHLLFSNGKETQATSAFNRITCDKGDGVVCYSAWLYLKALLMKKKAPVEEACAELKQQLAQAPEEPLLLWFLLYTDKEYEGSRQRKFAAIKAFCQAGCYSPLLYFEAAQMMKEEPALLKELDTFTLCILQFGLKWNYFGKEIALYFASLAQKEKQFRNLVYHVLEGYFKKYKIKELLNAICTLLIRGHKTELKYLARYCNGMQEQLKIAELPEYYLYAAEESQEERLEPAVYLYYSNHRALDERKKAFLYSCLIKNRNDYEVQYRIYESDMLEFSKEKVREGVINRNMSILYENFLEELLCLPNYAVYLANLMFSHEITCNNEAITSVCVVHKEMKQVQTVPFINGKAILDIYTDDSYIFFLDKIKNCYHSTIEYTIFPLIHGENLALRCYELGAENSRLLLHLSEKIIYYQKFDAASIAVRQKAAEIEELCDDYRRDCILSLINYYYDNYDGEILERCLVFIDLHFVPQKERTQLIEYMIIRDLYNNALKAMAEFGFEGVEVKRLFKLCQRLLTGSEAVTEKLEIILSICYYIFCAGKYDEAVLNYLLNYFYGTTDEMFTLWQAAKNFDMDTEELEERLLGQMLFAENNIENACVVFMSYYRNGLNHVLIRAFLSYYAYRYLTGGVQKQAELFEIMKKESSYEENEISNLAFMKYLSEKEKLTESEIKFADYHLHAFEKKGILLPFFKNFAPFFCIPQQMHDKYYIEYQANKDSIVTLSYGINKEEMQQELMKHIFCGLFVKEFVLFTDDVLQYQITEETNGEVINTGMLEICRKHEDIGNEDTRYGKLNLIITARELSDDTAAAKLLEQYLLADFLTAKLFNPIL